MAHDATVGVVQNRGPNQHAAVLERLLGKARDADIAVAFVSEKGLQQVISALRNVTKSGCVRFLTGLMGAVTEPHALQTLLSVAEASNGRFEVRLSRSRHFHQKVYLLHTETTTTAIVGSANLTMEGMEREGEISVVLTMDRARRVAKGTLEAEFEEQWRRHATPLTVKMLRTYMKHRGAVEAHGLSAGILRKILGPPERLQKPRRRTPTGRGVSTPSEAPRYFQWAMQDFLSPRTEDVLAKETSWERRGLSYTGSAGERTGDLVLIVEYGRAGRQARVVRVIETVRTAVPTPDGRDFVAYRQLPRSRWRQRRVTVSLRKSLRAGGLRHSAGKLHIGRMRANLWSVVEECFRK